MITSNLKKVVSTSHKFKGRTFPTEIDVMFKVVKIRKTLFKKINSFPIFINFLFKNYFVMIIEFFIMHFIHFLNII